MSTMPSSTSTTKTGFFARLRTHVLAASPAALLLALPALMGAKGGCGGAVLSKTDAPDVEGSWSIAYDDKLGVEVNIGGSLYTTELGPQGGTFTIDHKGTPISFNLDCSRPEIVCPSEAWPKTVKIEQRSTEYDHQMVVTLPLQSCSGKLEAPAPSECGAGTNNPDCDKVCNGTVAVNNVERFGVIDEDGRGFNFLLGANVATNGVNCVLLGASVVTSDLVNKGSSATNDWEATSMKNGKVMTGYAGGCLWVGDPNVDKQLEALVVGAGVKFTTGFTGTKQ